MTKAEKWIENGWIQQDNGTWLSKQGRIADYPGGPLRGQLSKLENAIFRAGRSEAIEEATHRNIRRIHLVPRYSAGGMYPVYDYRVEYGD